jgi:hypothetical protein
MYSPAYRMSRGRDGEMKWPLEPLGSSDTFCMLKRIQIVCRPLLPRFTLTLTLYCTDGALVNTFSGAGFAPTEDCYVFKPTAGSS